MQKILSFIFLIVFSISYLSPTIGNAIDPATSGRILDNFKEKQEEILFDSAPLDITDASKILEQEYTLNGLDSLKARLKGIESLYQEKKEAVGEVRISLEKALANISDSIKTTETSISDTEAAITQKDQKIQELHATSVSIKMKIREHRQIILSYLVNIYSEGNNIIDETGKVDLIKGMILTSEDTDFSLSDITYKTLVTQMGQKFVNEYRDLVRSLYLSQVQEKKEEKQLQELKIGLQEQANTLITQKAEQQKLLEYTQGQEALYVQYIAAQQQAQAQVESLWQEASDKYQESFETLLTKYNCNKTKKTNDMILECARIRQYFINEKELAKSQFQDDTSNIFSWPVESRRITSFFHDSEYYQALRSHHEAIDIGTEQGSDVIAPADGYVYFVLPPLPGGYSYLAIKHRDGYVSVYGHLSEINVEKYEFVKRGQLIAKSGGAPGTAGAGPMTSGAHLHFELWKNREPIDPLRHLSLVGIDYSTLLSVYQDKFITDLIEYSGTGADTTQYKKKFNIYGSTEIERQKYLLSKYATPDFQNWQMWVDTALDAKIDPSFMMCIGLAETTLGNHLKTPFNIGNIGNTDSGSTYSFASPQEGLTWMTATFNNRFLGKYTKVSELSRWGNIDGSIYASSNSNWHNNTIRCLSALKGEFVEDGFEFRLK
ncbi:peptidoglycan DD-metalloendopeptidase family protein [Candidatus Gracilibacteria bacterium]|nr:peptidoglycan DD-metalloendopeptidase family protein [Candidatus Gracilibacteria bacterium]